METVVPRRTVIVAAGAALAGAGCLSGDDGAPESGTVDHPDEEQYEIEATEGDTLRIELTNESGVATLVKVRNPEYDVVVEMEVESENALTHDVEQGGTHRVRIAPFGKASHET